MEKRPFLFSKESFDLVLTDIKMPEKTGIDVLKFAKSHTPNILVILMTAFGSVENAVETLNSALPTTLDQALSRNRSRL